MILHLSMDESCDIALITAQHFASVILGKIALEMLNCLRGQIVEKVGMVIVGNVVKINQATHHIIL